jgi:hypothetical protein
MLWLQSSVPAGQVVELALAMTRFATDCSDEEIRKAVVEWSELLVLGEYAAALRMFPHTSESFGFEWTPEDLEDWISNYGCARKDYDSGEYRKITSLFEQPGCEEFIRKAIKVDRKHLFGRDPKRYVGMVHYDDVPLDGEPSDLTARFHIKRVDGSALTLEFLDIHVM